MNNIKNNKEIIDEIEIKEDDSFESIIENRLMQKRVYRNTRRHKSNEIRRHNKLKYLKSNRKGLIDEKNGFRRYATKYNREFQKLANKKIRQQNLKISNELLDIEYRDEYKILNENNLIDSSFKRNGRGYKKLAKNNYDCVFFYSRYRNKPGDVVNIPDINITKNEFGVKVV